MELHDIKKKFKLAILSLNVLCWIYFLYAFLVTTGWAKNITGLENTLIFGLFSSFPLFFLTIFNFSVIKRIDVRYIIVVVALIINIIFLGYLCLLFRIPSFSSV